MKNSDLEKKIKASIRKHYVRKRSHDALKKKYTQLQKRLAKLEKLCAKHQVAEPKESNSALETQSGSARTSSSSSTADDLTRIKGIGPVLAGKLERLGVNSLVQIAAWNEEDIERVSAHLDFKGRIEREEWISQAKALN